MDRACSQAWVSRTAVRHAVEHAGVAFVRPAEPPKRPDDAILFVGDDATGERLEVVGVELDDGRLRVIHAMRCDAHELSRALPGGAAMADVSKPRKSGLKSRAGTALTEAYEQELADEAESGFDPSKLVPRRAGRPSLSGRSGHSHRVDLRVDDSTYLAIQRIAQRDDRKVSDIVRDAIHRYLEAG